MIQNINTETHLVLVGHRNSLWNTRKQLKYMELITNNTQNANTVPVYAVIIILDRNPWNLNQQKLGKMRVLGQF